MPCIFDGFVNVWKLLLANKQVFIVDSGVNIRHLNEHMSSDTSEGQGLIDSDCNYFFTQRHNDVGM